MLVVVVLVVVVVLLLVSMLLCWWWWGGWFGHLNKLTQTLSSHGPGYLEDPPAIPPADPPEKQNITKEGCAQITKRYSGRAEAESVTIPTTAITPTTTTTGGAPCLNGP